jgi:ribonuclease D
MRGASGVTDENETTPATDTTQAPTEPAPRTSALTVIDTREAYLDAVTKIAAGYGPIAVDAERASGFKFSQRAYLIQLYRRGAGSFLFDPPAIGSFSELNDAIAREEWILHAASQDLACLREVGLDPRVIFDTELAARLLGIPRVGLGSVVEEFLGIHLKKEHSAADWSRRPLPESWLEYAALDVELLPDLRDKLAELLIENSKAVIAAQEFEATRAKASIRFATRAMSPSRDRSGWRATLWLARSTSLPADSFPTRASWRPHVSFPSRSESLRR